MFTRHRTSLALWIILSAASLAPAVAHAQPTPTFAPDRPAGGVADTAGALDAAARGRVEALIADVEARSGVRLAVAVVRDTGGQSIEAYSLALFRAWALGDNTGGRGALFVVAVGTRKNYLEVGTALFDTLPEPERQRILVEVFRPTARASGPGPAVEAVMEALRSRVAPTAAPMPAPTPAPTYQSPPIPTGGPAFIEPVSPADESPTWPFFAFGGVFVLGAGLLVRGVRKRARAPGGYVAPYGASSHYRSNEQNASSHDHNASSYDASSFAAGAMMASSDCASSDCASSDCASSDCASSDCASSDCASSDCGGSGSDW